MRSSISLSRRLFTNVPLGNHVLRNVGPDEPFGGGVPGEDFDRADPDTTGQVLQFRVGLAVGTDSSTPLQFLQLPAIAPLPATTTTRQLALIEEASEGADEEGEEVEGPVEALLGTVANGVWTQRKWMDPVTENPAIGATEIWEIYNTTADAHPMHIHEIVFEVVDRQRLVLNIEGEVRQPIELEGDVIPPEPWEHGLKDTVIAYPGQVTRLKGRFTTPGQFVWHCHIVEHEDNEMMRPYRVGPPQPGQPE
jgi:FtsP/CotA-like multicopper oxidase with cupredoxin domain